MNFTYADDTRYDVALEHSESDDEEEEDESSSDEGECGVVSRCIRVRF